MIDLELIITVAASAVFLGLAALTAVRGKRGNALALPTALLCVDLFAYLGFGTLGEITGAPIWECFEAAAAALSGPLLFHLTLAFVGARRSRRVQLRLSYLAFGAVALSSLAPLLDDRWAGYAGGESWALAMLACTLPTFVYALWLLARHYRHSGRGEERARTQLFIATVGVGVGGASTDLVAIGGAPVVPQLADPAMLISAVLLTALALRARLVAGGLGTSVLTASLIGVIAVVAQFIVFRSLGSTTAALGLGTIGVTVVVIGAARAVWASYTEVQARTAHLATLGRLSSQMAHDIRNPLAAIRGAAQYLDEERKRGGSLRDNEAFLELILEQTERLDRVVGDYRRLGRAEPVFEEVDVEALIERVVENAQLGESAQLGVPHGDVDIQREASSIGTWRLDPELVATALENLVRNAIEALGERAGSVRVRAHAEEQTLSLSVTDDGPGMDARTREQAEQAFFTTKATGSGLGLAFARRVAEAHDGRLRIESALDRGTTVVLTLRQPRASVPA